MRTERLRASAKFCRFGGYFVLLAGIVATVEGPAPVIHQIYSANRWPVASAVVKQFSQHSRIDMYRERNGFHPRVYWMEFQVALGLPAAQCPPPMRTATRDGDACTGLYATLETDSPAAAWRRGSRHPILSTVQVHYDASGASGNRVLFVGESAKDTYPWRELAVAAGIFAFALLLFFVSVRTNAKADKWEILERS